MADPYRRRCFFANAMLRSPGGSGGGNGSGRGAGGSSFARITLSSATHATAESGGDTAPLTLGQAFTAQVRLIVWCKACGHRAEPDVAERVSHHGSGMIVI